ncbi:hypothetical protein SB00610_04091 [Klebsiella quasipneumoniae subsp. similipneumoniae]|nr:hypothetical protein SB00610_04091 [Klebsiella quasipneumoniae subsp. similipneumoniae]
MEARVRAAAQLVHWVLIPHAPIATSAQKVRMPLSNASAWSVWRASAGAEGTLNSAIAEAFSTRRIQRLLSR